MAFFIAGVGESRMLHPGANSFAMGFIAYHYSSRMNSLLLSCNRAVLFPDGMLGELALQGAAMHFQGARSRRDIAFMFH